MTRTIANSLALVQGSDKQQQESLGDTKPKDFERAVTLELPVLYRVARRLGSSPEEAEDLVQSTVFKAYRKWHQFDGRFLRSWLVRILRNERLAGLRSSKPVADWDEVTDDCLVEEPFWSTVEANIQAEMILKELDMLPMPYRDVIQLCDVEQMSYEEASVALDVPVGTVRSRLFRARVELRRRLGGTY